MYRGCYNTKWRDEVTTTQTEGKEGVSGSQEAET